MKEENAAITLSISLDQEGCIRYNTTQITIPQPVFTPSFLIIKQDIQVEKIVKKPAPAPTEGEKKEEAPAMIEEKVMETQHGMHFQSQSDFFQSLPKSIFLWFK